MFILCAIEKPNKFVKSEDRSGEAIFRCRTYYVSSRFH